jgi:hypothetical protein
VEKLVAEIEGIWVIIARKGQGCKVRSRQKQISRGRTGDSRPGQGKRPKTATE